MQTFKNKEKMFWLCKFKATLHNKRILKGEIAPVFLIWKYTLSNVYVAEI